MRQKPIHGISVHCTGVILLLHYLCTVQSKQGKANAALSILSRPKLFCRSGFTFTWRTSTCTRPQVGKHNMKWWYNLQFHSTPTHNSKNTSIKYQYSSKTHTEKHLYQCNTKYRRFQFFKHENTKIQIFSSLSLSDVKPPTQLTQIRPELQRFDNQAKIQIPDDFTQFMQMQIFSNKCVKKYFQTLKSSATLYLLPTEQFFGAIEQLFRRRKNCDDCVGAHMVTFSVLWVINLSIWDAKRFLKVFSSKQEHLLFLSVDTVQYNCLWTGGLENVLFDTFGWLEWISPWYHVSNVKLLL